MISLRPWLSQHPIRFAPLVMISSALTLVLLISGWGMYRDLRAVSDSVTSTEIAQIRSHAERTVRRIESELSEVTTLTGFLSLPEEREWLETHWRRTVLADPAKLYAAIVSADLVPLAHSDALSSNGKLLGSGALSTASLLLPHGGVPLDGFGQGVSLVKDARAGRPRKILDIQVPINAKDGVSGSYRIGLAYDALQDRIRMAQKTSIRGWSVVMAGTAAVVVGACLSLYRLGMHSFRLEQALSLAETEPSTKTELAPPE